LKAKVYQRLGWKDAYGVNCDAAFADIENNSAVVGADIQVGEGLDLLAGADARSRPSSELPVCVDIGAMG
jgi:hypothetical protein